ncbi:hypothetical protein EI94DRAFT_1805671 [Lactarius quietus]|nr:hypothetical protein EI94DRAFT_1805671 [Lactarius quietus]
MYSYRPIYWPQHGLRLASPAHLTPTSSPPYPPLAPPYASPGSPYAPPAPPYPPPAPPYACSASPYATPAPPYTHSASPYATLAPPYASSTSPYAPPAPPYTHSAPPYTSPAHPMPLLLTLCPYCPTLPHPTPLLPHPRPTLCSEEEELRECKITLTHAWIDWRYKVGPVRNRLTAAQAHGRIHPYLTNTTPIPLANASEITPTIADIIQEGRANDVVWLGMPQLHDEESPGNNPKTSHSTTANHP